MTIDFTCQKCDASFEIDAQDLIDGTEKLVCPHCEAKASGNMVDDFIAALTEMRSQVAKLAKKFAVTMAIETEDLEEAADAKEEDEEEAADKEDDDELDFEDDDEEEDDDELEDEDADK